MSLLIIHSLSLWGSQLTVRLKDICSMTKEKTARLIPNAIQVCTDSEKVSEWSLILALQPPTAPDPLLLYFCPSVA